MPETEQNPSGDFAPRIAGYFGVLIILGFAIWFSTFLIHEVRRYDRILRVQFPELGTLIVEDPVVRNGVPIGRVKSLTLQNGQALAELELFHRDFIPADSRFINFNHSLMGARMVVLLPGSSKNPLDEATIQTGFFADGVAESLRRVNDLLATVATIRAQIDQLTSGPNAAISPALLNHLNDNALQLNRLALKVDQGGKSLRAGLESWVHAEYALQKGLTTVHSGMDSSEKQITTFLNSANAAEQQVDMLLSSAEKLLVGVQDSTGITHSLLNDPKVYDNIKTSLVVLDSALRILQGDGLHHVVGWKNIHFFK